MLAERINRLWRIAGTGLAFLAFGLGGLFLRVLVFPPLQWFVRDPERQRLLARRIIQRSFAAHVELMRRLGLLTYEIRHRERLDRPGLLVLANHPTLIDVVFLVSLLPNADCVVKSAVAKNPFMRGPVRSAGYVSNEDGAGLVDDCIAAVRAGGALVIFPEGTRTPIGQPLKLQRGAANIAIRGRIDVTPVRLSCTPPTLGKGEKWYRVPARRFHVVVDVQEDLPIGQFLDANDPDGGGDAAAARRLTEFLATYFAGEQAGAGT